MITETIRLLKMAEWEGISDNIEIAKGKNQLPKTIKQGIKQEIRKWQIKKK